MVALKQALVLQAARLVGEAVRLTGRSGGTALPGLLVERAAPELIQRLASRLDAGAIVVSGTNGKTTTSRLIARALEGAGYRVVHNRSGSNLMRGIAAALAQDTPQSPLPQGEGQGEGDPVRFDPHLNPLPARERKPLHPSIGLFEVDEATVPLALPVLRPRAVVLLNLFRDQLDRYGEVDTIARLWRGALEDLPADCTVALNADDPMVASLGKGLPQRALYYGLEDRSHGLSQRERAADFLECLACGVPYQYSLTYYGHLGHYACPSCGWTRPAPAVKSPEAKLDGLNGSTTVVEDPNERITLSLPLPGLYNQYNLLAAAAGVLALGLPLSALVRAVEGFQPAFGRAERFRIEGKDIIMLLTKNPVGANQVVRLLASIPGRKPMLLALNDLAADGEDISWIWDADYEGLQSQIAWAVIAGRRAEDLALRLKYAGCWGEVFPAILNDPEQAFRTAIYRLEPGETLYVLPTYTAMLELRAVLNRMGIVKPFWEEA